MLDFQPLTETTAPPERLVQLLEEAKSVLLEHGMADMDEYGDMLKWGLPKKDGWCRNIHVYHPDWCSFSDAFWGTIHYHPGTIRGTVLLGGMEHYTYRATQSPDGNRFLAGVPYLLEKHTNVQPSGTAYTLPPYVPHWLKPTALTLTYFEEEDNGEMGDLLNPVSRETDEHTWTQEMADSLLPQLLDAIDQRLVELRACLDPLAA